VAAGHGRGSVCRTLGDEWSSPGATRHRHNVEMTSRHPRVLQCMTSTKPTPAAAASPHVSVTSRLGHLSSQHASHTLKFSVQLSVQKTHKLSVFFCIFFFFLFLFRPSGGGPRAPARQAEQQPRPSVPQRGPLGLRCLCAYESQRHVYLRREEEALREPAGRTLRVVLVRRERRTGRTSSE
jgi:hypothetical protein